jgi:hypothetical protein
MSLDEQLTQDETPSSEIDQLWAEEAERRYQELIEGKVEAIPLEEALRQARAAL